MSEWAVLKAPGLPGGQSRQVDPRWQTETRRTDRRTNAVKRSKNCCLACLNVEKMGNPSKNEPNLPLVDCKTASDRFRLSNTRCGCVVSVLVLRLLSSDTTCMCVALWDTLLLSDHSAPLSWGLSKRVELALSHSEGQERKLGFQCVFFCYKDRNDNCLTCQSWNWSSLVDLLAIYMSMCMYVCVYIYNLI